ncbi:uncharacterized protein LOC126783687 [Argentina anserina]|uniref:uncharacterized protein LOC126783687 n=1 Tax=Argentina anserina TaxID=57926 RepID=UPI0021768E50|nr:uncharacterized protein LOC126783687 [Potentilla anserina]
MALSVATKLQPSICEPRAVLVPGGNRVRVSEGPKHKYEGLKKPPQRPRKPAAEIPESVVRKNVSVDSSCSSDTSSTGSSPKTASPRKTVRKKSLRPSKLVSNDVVKPEGPPKRCEWITPNSDPHYISFHDEEWGVPVHDDKKLFELLVLSQSLAELSWPEMLTKRDIFRNLFDNFDPTSVANFDEKKLLSLKVNGIPILSQQKLRAIVDNAIQVVKIQQEFGSFSKYCWSFVNQKPINNGVRYGRQVPVKSPKSEVISKDLMKRGFRCVGPTVVYSFMQVAGIVNDHLVSCFRHKECDASAKIDVNLEIEKSKDRVN